MDYGFTTAAYVVAAVLFILSLGGLSGQESAKRAVWYGIVGMALAVFATLIGPGSGLWLLSLLLIAAGGAIGWYVAKKVEMTEMPQLVAAMHSLVGLAAVFVGFNAHFTMKAVQNAHAAGETITGEFAQLVAHKTPVELSILSVELFLGIFIGAITFTGSVIAYGKLAGKVTSTATKLPGGHVLNASAAAISVLCLFWYAQSGGFLPLLLMTLAALFIGYHLIMGIGGADMPVVVSMLNSYSGLILPLIASATATFLFRQFFMTVPDELAEAARVDGARPMRFFWDILLPMSRTNIAALFVILFIYGWNQYLWPLLITTDPSMNTIVMGIKQMFPSGDDIADWPVIMATSILAMIPPVIVVISMQKLFIRGLVDSEK